MTTHDVIFRSEDMRSPVEIKAMKRANEFIFASLIVSVLLLLIFAPMYGLLGHPRYPARAHLRLFESLVGNVSFVEDLDPKLIDKPLNEDEFIQVIQLLNSDEQKMAMDLIQKLRRSNIDAIEALSLSAAKHDPNRIQGLYGEPVLFRFSSDESFSPTRDFFSLEIHLTGANGENDNGMLDDILITIVKQPVYDRYFMAYSQVITHKYHRQSLKVYLISLLFFIGLGYLIYRDATRHKIHEVKVLYPLRTLLVIAYVNFAHHSLIFTFPTPGFKLQEGYPDWPSFIIQATLNAHVAIACLLLIIAISQIIQLRKDSAKQKKLATLICPRCNYDLRGSVTEDLDQVIRFNCPECDLRIEGMTE